MGLRAGASLVHQAHYQRHYNQHQHPGGGVNQTLGREPTGRHRVAPPLPATGKRFVVLFCSCAPNTTLATTATARVFKFEALTKDVDRRIFTAPNHRSRATVRVSVCKRARLNTSSGSCGLKADSQNAGPDSTAASSGKEKQNKK